MPPKHDSRLRQALTPADRDTELEMQRLRETSEGLILQKHSPQSTHSEIPRILTHSDNADIIKRNSSHKKKYLFIFPGTLSLCANAKIGNLSGLNTRTPKLLIEIPQHGRILLSGSLVFPKNAFITMRAPTKRGKPLQIVDTCETLVVFSEWAWVGKEETNPGQIPEPLPEMLKRDIEEAQDLWKVKGGGEVQKREGKEKGMEMSEDSFEMERLEEEREENDDDDDDSQIEWKGAGSLKMMQGEGRRTSARKKSRKVKYVQDSDEEIEVMDESEGGSDGSKEKIKKEPPKRKRATLGVQNVIDLVDDDDIDDITPVLVNKSSARKRRRRVLSNDEYEEDIDAVPARKSVRSRKVVSYVNDEEEEEAEVEDDNDDLGTDNLF